MALFECDAAASPMVSDVAVRLLRAAGALDAPELFRAVLNRLEPFAVATQTANASEDGQGSSGLNSHPTRHPPTSNEQGKDKGQFGWGRLRLRSTGGLAASAVQPPALICHIQSEDVANALCGAMQSLGWSALEGWNGWSMHDAQGKGVTVEVVEKFGYSVWITAARGTSSDDSERLKTAAAKSEPRPARSDAVRAYCNFNDLAGACLDPAGSAAGGAKACTVLARQLLLLLWEGRNRGYQTSLAEAEVRLLALADALGDVGLATDVLRGMAGGICTGNNLDPADGGTANDASRDCRRVGLGPSPADLNNRDLVSAVKAVVLRFGWAAVGSRVKAVLEANRRKVCCIRSD
jgi:hypothetical protein